MGSVSSGMTCGLLRGGGIFDRPVWSNMLTGGYTLGGAAGAAYGVASGAAILRGGEGDLYFGGTVCVFLLLVVGRPC